MIGDVAKIGDKTSLPNRFFNRILKGLRVKLVLSTYCVWFMSLNSSSRDSFPDNETKSMYPILDTNLFWIQTSHSDSD